MRTVAERLIGSLWTVATAIIIFFAVIISIARLLLPEIGQQRESIASWLSAYIDRPIVIGEVSASWHGWTPSIRVDELVIMNEAGETEIARFDFGTIDIALFRSIARVSLIPTRLVVSGMEAAFERDADGTLRIAGMPPSRWPVAQWILQQENFTLTDAVVSYTDLTREQSAIKFSNATITVAESDAGQLVQGRLRRQDAAAEVIDFALRVDGDLLGSQWDGELFVNARDTDIRSALELLGLSGDHFSGGTLGARFFSRWTDAQLIDASMVLGAANVVTRTGDEERTIDRIDVTGFMTRIDDGWWLDLDKMQLNVGTAVRPAGSVALRWREREGAASLFAFCADNINLEELSPLLPEFSAPKGPRAWSFRDIRLQGTLHEVVGAWTRESTPRYYVEGAVDKLSIDDVNGKRSLRGLNFSARANGHGGVFSAQHTAGVVVTAEDTLARPIEIQKISGTIIVERAANTLRVSSRGLDLRAEGIDLTTRGHAVFDSDKSPYLNFVTRINSGALADVGTLVPVGKLPPRGDRWVRTAFRSGHFEPSRVLFRGHTADFPFDNGNGTFKANFEVRDVDLKYSLKWPLTKSIDATVEVENRTTKTLVHDGLMYSAELAGSTIEMPNLFTRKPVVRVQGSIRVTADELDRFIDESPLKQTKAIRFQDVDIDGEFGMTLDMNLGIYPGGEKDILGLAQFAGNRIDAPKQKLSLSDVHGDVSFTRQDWYGEGLRAVYDGDPVGVVLHGGLDDPNYDTEFRMTGTSAAPQLLKIINTYAPYLGTLITQGGTNNAVGGKLPWKVVMTIPETNPNGATAPKRLTIDSSLVGLKLDLPWPFGKSTDENKPLSILSETETDGQRRIRVSYGTTMDIEFDQNPREDGTLETSRAEFVFGEQSPTFTGAPGLRASGNIGRLPLNEWAAFAQTAAQSMAGSNRTFPISFDVHVDRLEVLGRTFPDANLAGSKADDQWQVNVESPQLIGRIIVPHQDPARPLSFDFERMWLTERTDPDSTTTFDPRDVPPLELTAGSLRFGKLDLGRAEVSTSRDTDGLKLERVHFSHTGFELDGSGHWSLRGDAQQSRVHLEVQGDSLGGLLSRFGYAVANIDGGTTDMEIDAAWEGMPSEFSLEKLQGSFTLHVDEGRFLDIEPGGGRLFGLLSLQTLPRRLSLDFNDLFKKGFTFDRIEGAFELDHGNAYTNSLLMDGPAARIDISGRTGLADQDYDQRVTVTPALSDTIPVAGAFFGPAGIGVGAVIYLGQKMFKSIPEQVDKFLSREYSITGGWSQPVIERI